MINPVHPLWTTLVELFYPSHCVVCASAQGTGRLLCDSCQSTTERIRPPFCETCSRPYEGAISRKFVCPNCEDHQFAFRYAVSPYRASGIVRELIHRMKYGGQFHLRRILADWLWEAFSDPRIRDEPCDAIVPIPLHPTRLRERGFNQACAIAEIVARRAGVSLLPCLERRRYTETQTRFDRKDRMRNLREAFALRNSMPVSGKRLLLVDDVLTTGSTLHECALVLLAAGADSVRAVTVARG